MTPKEFSKIVAAAQAGQPQDFNRFYKKLYKKCKANLLSYVSTNTEAEDAFSEVICKFWKKFIVEGDPLPKKNIEGYIFTMAKFHCINQRHVGKKQATETGEILKLTKKIAFIDDKSEADFWKEQIQEDYYQTALKKGIKKLGKECRKVFEYILKHDTDKPRELWEPLGYKNAGTVSSVKSDCKKRLKIKVAVELDLLHQLKPNKNVNYN